MAPPAKNWFSILWQERRALVVPTHVFWNTFDIYVNYMIRPGRRAHKIKHKPIVWKFIEWSRTWSPKCVVFAAYLKQPEMCGPGVVPLYVVNYRMVPTRPFGPYNVIKRGGKGKDKGKREKKVLFSIVWAGMSHMVSSCRQLMTWCTGWASTSSMLG